MDLSRLLPGPLCDEAREWLSRQPDAKTAWDTCQRGDWLLHQLWASTHVTRQRLVACACECARLALHHVPADEHRPRIAIDTAEAWCRGEAPVEQLRVAQSDAYAAYAASAATLASAAFAARAAYVAAHDASTLAALAADEAAYAAADAGDSRLRVLAQCADIVRKHFTLEDLVGEDHG